jgi:hypothetical protein
MADGLGALPNAAGLMTFMAIFACQEANFYQSADKTDL